MRREAIDFLPKPVMVAEYSQQKETANRIAFSVRDNMGMGTCIWEPLSTWEKIFDQDGKVQFASTRNRKLIRIQGIFDP